MEQSVPVKVTKRPIDFVLHLTTMTATNGKATEEEESKINKLEPNNQEDQEETNAEEDEAEVEESKEETESAEHQQEAEYVNEGRLIVSVKQFVPVIIIYY
jgi:hypothetical protein